MHVSASHGGGLLPFERDRRLVLRRIPVGAVVTRAVLTLTPVSTDAGRRFLETLTFADGIGDWGASKVVTATAVEVDLHARRKLASLVGSNLGSGTLLADLGGGFLGVNAAGGLGGGPALPTANTMDLPGLTVTGLRAAIAGLNPPLADISLLRVSSPPSNVTLAVEGGPVFFAHFGELVEPATTPDFSDVLQALLPRLDVAGGCYVVPITVHSDTIARLDLGLELEYAVVVAGAPAGVRTVQAPYAFDGAPVAGQGRLSVLVPPGMVATAGGTAGRVQGAFAATRVVHGPVTATGAPELVPVAAGHTLAQPFACPTTQVASSVDLQLTAVSATVRIAVDLVNDLDGKPGRTSMLARPAELTLTRDEAGAPTWVNVPLPAEVEVAAGIGRWLVVQALEGSAAWSAAAASADAAAAVPTAVPTGPGLQQTRDGGLSWRAVAGDALPGPLGALLRLRHTTQGFQLPLELRVGAGTGAGEVAVSLQRFAASGGVDFGLGFPEVAQAVNTALATAGGGATPGGGEQVANGDFADWFRVGTTVRPSSALRRRSVEQLTFGTCGFGADSARVHTVGSTETQARYVSYGVFSGIAEVDEPIAAGFPLALALDAAGRTALVSIATSGFQPGAAAGGSGLVLVDTGTGRPIGAPVDPPEASLALAAAADGLGVYLAGLSRSQTGPTTTVRHVAWADLRAAAAGSAVPWGDLPEAVVDGMPLDLAVGPDGLVVVLTAGDPNADGTPGDARLTTFADRAAVTAGDAREVVAVPQAVALAVLPSGDEILTLARHEVRFLRATDLTTIVDVPFPDSSGTARALAVDPTGELVLVVRGGGVDVLDAKNRRLLVGQGVELPTSDAGATVAINPAGTHAVVLASGTVDANLLTIGDALPAEWELTAGQVRPVALPTTGEVLALLGSTTSISRKQVSPPASMSQALPVAGGARYRFSFDGLAFVEGAVAQVRWNGDACSPERVDRVPVQAVDLEQRSSVNSIPHHQAILTAPAGATQAEVRFWTPESILVVDKVSLAGSGDVATSTWTPTAPTTTVTPSDAGLTLSNGGAAAAAVAQVVAATPGDQFELVLAANVTGEPGAAVELAFADDAGGPVGDVVEVPLDALDFDRRAAVGEVPAGTAEAEVRVVLPPGAAVELTDLTLTLGAATEVGLYFASQAPGDLGMTDVAVTLDRGSPRPVPVPPGGLCPATPAGDGPEGESCYCQACGKRGPAGRATPALTAAGRPVSVTPCPTCGTPRLRVGGRPVLRAATVGLPRYRVVDRTLTAPAAGRGPAIVSRVRVDAPLTSINGIAGSRADQLAKIGIGDVVALARADVRVVAALPRVSDRMAAAFIAEAERLVRERGRRVVFD